MALTSVGAIFATQSLLLQRIYIPDFDDSEINRQSISPGESLLLVPIQTYQAGGQIAVQAAVGTPTFSGRCAIVDNTNTVIDHLVADPVLYTDARGSVIASDHSIVGDSWDGTKFSRQYIECDHITGLVVGVSVQPILTAAPLINVLNFLTIGASLPNAQIGQSVPGLTAKILAHVISPPV